MSECLTKNMRFCSWKDSCDNYPNNYPNYLGAYTVLSVTAGSEWRSSLATISLSRCYITTNPPPDKNVRWFI